MEGANVLPIPTCGREDVSVIQNAQDIKLGTEVPVFLPPAQQVSSGMEINVHQM